MNISLSHWIQRLGLFRPPAVPESCRTLFFTEIATLNFSRAVLLSLLLTVAHLFLILLNFSERYQNGVWQNAGYERLAYLHFTLVGTLSLFLLVAYFIRRRPRATRTRYAL
ncbi:MAG: hypothetical protein NZ844_10850, partial [Chloroherpetonaceae bacterium]|nr:hypothetical protein [Chloroherpetonaceae bacterium]